MYQFFVEPSQIQGNQIVITGSDVNHIKNVLRMQVGEELSVSNGVDNREYRCGIEELGEDSIRCSLRFVKEDGLELSSRIYLFQGLPKADKMELIIQKAVELGTYSIIPVATHRSVVKLNEKKAVSKIQRWQAISEAAAKQSKRRIIPEVQMPMNMQQAVQFAAQMEVKLIPYELSEGMQKTKELISNIRPGQNIAVFIGPEGGFDDKEIEMAQNAGIIPITMGRRILRTETAGFTILSWLMYHLEQ